MSSEQFTVGGLVRLLVNEPDGSPYAIHSVLTIRRLGVQHTRAGYGIPYAVLEPGGYAVTLEHLAPVAMHDNIHPDVDYDATVEELEAFEEIADLDPLLRKWRGLTMEQVAALEGIETPAPATPDGGVATAAKGKPQPLADPEQLPVERAINLTDRDGDLLEVLYLEAQGPTGAFTAVYRFQINKELAVEVPAEVMPKIIAWLTRWAIHYRDDPRPKG